jgi:hypothetical protein
LFYALDLARAASLSANQGRWALPAGIQFGRGLLQTSKC